MEDKQAALWEKNHKEEPLVPDSTGAKGRESQRAGVETEQDPVGLLGAEAFLSPISCL